MTTDFSSELTIIKYIASGGFIVYIIDKIFKVVYTLKEIQNRDGKVKNFCEIEDIKEPIWSTKNNVDAMHKVITDTKDGVPLIYNPGLKNSIEKLDSSINKLSSTIKNDRS